MRHCKHCSSTSNSTAWASGCSASRSPRLPPERPSSARSGRVESRHACSTNRFRRDNDLRRASRLPNRFHFRKASRIDRSPSQQSRICFDTETTGLDPREAIPLGSAFSLGHQHMAYYVVCPDDQEQARAESSRNFDPFSKTKPSRIVGHNLKYDLTLLRWHGIVVQGKLIDTMLAHSMKEPEMQHGLDYLAKLYLGYRPIPIERPDRRKGPASNETCATFRSNESCRIRLRRRGCDLASGRRPCDRTLKSRAWPRSATRSNVPLIPVLVDMEYEGIRLDADALESVLAATGAGN